MLVSASGWLAQKGGRFAQKQITVVHLLCGYWGGREEIEIWLYKVLFFKPSFILPMKPIHMT